MACQLPVKQVSHDAGHQAQVPGWSNQTHLRAADPSWSCLSKKSWVRGLEPLLARPPLERSPSGPKAALSSSGSMPSSCALLALAPPLGRHCVVLSARGVGFVCNVCTLMGPGAMGSAQRGWYRGCWGAWVYGQRHDGTRWRQLTSAGAGRAEDGARAQHTDARSCSIGPRWKQERLQ